MARHYLKPGDRAQALCDLIVREGGEWSDPEILEVRFWREDEGHEDGGEWFEVSHDFDGSPGANPHWGRPYYGDESPGY